jgi:hypothetical protein
MVARDKSKGFRLDLGDELNAKLEDFCAAFYRGQKTQICREAVEHYIEWVLEREPERKKRYDVERRKRSVKVVQLREVKPSDEA